MKRFIQYLLWVLVTTLWATICFIVPDFLDSPTNTFYSVIIQIGYIGALGGGIFWILYLIGLNKYIASVFLPIFAIGGAGVAYFRVAQCATVTPMIVEATLHTNAGTIAGVVSWQLIAYIIFNVILTVIFLWWRFHIDAPKYACWHALGCVILLLGYYNFNSRLHKSMNQRYPYNVVYSTVEYLKMQHLITEERIIPEVYFTSEMDSLDVVFVLGEAMRSDHLGLNGYERNTTPRLQERSNVVTLPNIYSEYTYTSASVPHIMTIADSINPEASFKTTSFISCMEQCGYASAWISNQDYGKTYVSFIYEADTLIFPHADKSVFVYNEWVDIDLIAPFQDCLDREFTKSITVIHTIGSHWYYNNHVPQEMQVFQPVTDNRVVASNSVEQVVNSYDNTAYYLDYFLDSLYSTLADRNAIVLYLADHGESLGEGGRFFHAGNGKETHYPAAIVWYSDRYAQAFPDKVKALHLNHAKPYRTDFLFYSILSAAGIIPRANRPELDIFTWSE